MSDPELKWALSLEGSGQASDDIMWPSDDYGQDDNPDMGSDDTDDDGEDYDDLEDEDYDYDYTEHDELRVPQPGKCRLTGSLAGRQTDRQAHRQACRQADRQTGRPLP